MIVGAEAFYPTEIARLRGRGHAVGRLSVDVDVDPAVDRVGRRPARLNGFDHQNPQLAAARRNTVLAIQLDIERDIAVVAGRQDLSNGSAA